MRMDWTVEDATVELKRIVGALREGNEDCEKLFQDMSSALIMLGDVVPRENIRDVKQLLSLRDLVTDAKHEVRIIDSNNGLLGKLEKAKDYLAEDIYQAAGQGKGRGGSVAR
jgi:hypothetical protein